MLPVIQNLCMRILGGVRFVALSFMERETLQKAILGYVLRIHNHQKFNSLTGPILPPKDRKQLRIAASEDYDLMISFKCAVYDVLRRYIIHDRRAVQSVFEAYGLSGMNAGVFTVLYQHHWISQCTKVARTLVHRHPPREIPNYLNELLNRIGKWMRWYSYNKLRFIAKSNNYENDDNTCELRVRAIKAFYASYPFLPDKHLSNAMRQAAERYGVNMILFYKRKCRARLTDDTGQGHENTIRQYQEQYDIPDEKDAHGSVEFIHSMQALQGQLHPNKRLALDLLMGKDHQPFIDYANQKVLGRGRCKTTDDVYERLGREDFLRAVRRFVSAAPASFNRFLELVKSGCFDFAGDYVTPVPKAA